MKASFIQALGALTLGAFPLLSSGQVCDAIRQVPKNKDYVQSQFIDSSGSYCLKEDLKVKGIFSFGRSPRIATSILGVDTSNVILDFGTYNAWSDAQLEAGVDTTASYEPGHKVVNPPHSITIRNGSLRLLRRGVGISMVGLGGVFNGSPRSIASDNDEPKFSDTTSDDDRKRRIEEGRRILASEMDRARAEMPKLADYPNRKILIENMKIRTNRVGIVIQGAGTVIRDSVIEVDAGTAIWIYGPNAIIENNTIIVRGNFDPKSGLSLYEADAPIRLHHGDGAIVRNNRIVVSNRVNRRAISLFDTGRIRFESNQIYGLGQSDQLAPGWPLQLPPLMATQIPPGRDGLIMPFLV